jgi:hypothetical protein
MCGTRSATSLGNSFSLVPDPSSGILVGRLSGFTMAVEMNPNAKAPKPKPPIIRPDTSPLLSGNHSQPH